MNKLRIGVNFWDNGPAQLLCRAVLAEYREQHPEQIELYSPRIPGDGFCPDEFVDLPVLKTMCKDIVPRSKKRKPVIHEMIDSLTAVAESDWDLLVLMNSDIWMTPTAEKILLEMQEDCACFSRANISPVNCDPSRLTFYYDFPNGWDMFAFRAGWWRKNRQKFLQLPCIYAERAWDNAYACAMMAYGETVWHNKQPWILHMPHPGRWSAESVEGVWCGKKWTACGWEGPWRKHVTVMSKRQYFNNGETLLPACIEAEQKSERILFQGSSEIWMPSSQPEAVNVPVRALSQADACTKRVRSATFR